MLVEVEMKRRLVAFLLAAAALLLAGSCVTINVYFPAAAIKDLSRQIEDEVEKKAASEPPAEAPQKPSEKPQDKKPEPKPAGGTVSLLDTLLGVTPVYAQGAEVPAPDVSSPAIRKIIDSRAARAAALNRYKSRGVIGENDRALVEVRSLETLSDLKDRAELQRLVKAENADREELFKEIAVAKSVDLSQLPKIRETYASTLREKAHPGDWIQEPDGAWKRK